MANFTGHQGPVTAISFSENGGGVDEEEEGRVDEEEEGRVDEEEEGWRGW